MARTIIRVNATQLVKSQQNPQGLFSTMQNYPIDFDSNLSPYNGDVEKAMKAAKSAFYDRVGKNYGDTNENRIMTTVTIQYADGRHVVDPVCIGGLPVDPEAETQE